MKKRIGISMRVNSIAGYNEKRDAIDQNWIVLIESLGFFPILIPNKLHNVVAYCETLDLSGIILSGGNNLVDYHGDAPERDNTELKLIKWCIDTNKPLLGVCRGMQIINNYFGGSLKGVTNQVSPEMEIVLNNTTYKVNSYHDYGISELGNELIVNGLGKDDIIKAFYHSKYTNIIGIMWHPERPHIDNEKTQQIIKDLFNQ